jgi:transcription-repair coupling factor (superfamily II helicase)
VAVVVPTTLLAASTTRPSRTLPGLPVKRAPAVAPGPRQGSATRPSEAWPKGDVDIVVGTHALLGKT